MSPSPKVFYLTRTRLNIARGLLVTFAALLLIANGSRFWSWAHSRNAPQEMSIEDYLKNGSDNDWLVLTGVYIDPSSVQTQLVERGKSSGGYAGTYYPIRTGPDDKAPVRLFLKPRSIVLGSDQITLLDEPGGSAGAQKWTLGRNDRQTLRGMRLRGIDFQDDLEKVLHSCRLPTSDKLELIEQGRAPASNRDAFVIIAVMSAIVGLIGLTFVLPTRK